MFDRDFFAEPFLSIQNKTEAQSNGGYVFPKGIAKPDEEI